MGPMRCRLILLCFCASLAIYLTSCAAPRLDPEIPAGNQQQDSRASKGNKLEIYALYAPDDRAEGMTSESGRLEVRVLAAALLGFPRIIRLVTVGESGDLLSAEPSIKYGTGHVAEVVAVYEVQWTHVPKVGARIEMVIACTNRQDSDYIVRTVKVNR
jgi:hypothetical protein